MVNKKFKNRIEAGNQLSSKISQELKDLDNTVILAIPRGGVPPAYAISKKLTIPFHLIITKKLTLPQAPEVAMGAIAPDGSYEINERVYNYFNPSKEEFERAKDIALRKVEKRIENYTNSKEPSIEGKRIIIVDDGIATGYTALVAGKYAKNRSAKEVVLAVPVCPKDNIPKVLKVFDHFIYVHSSNALRFAVGLFYEDFHQNTDEELDEYMKKAENQNLLYKELVEATVPV